MHCVKSESIWTIMLNLFLGSHGLCLMCNFSFQSIATLCITVIPPFWYIVQAPSSGRIKQKEDKSRHIGLTIEVRVWHGAWFYPMERWHGIMCKSCSGTQGQHVKCGANQWKDIVLLTRQFQDELRADFIQFECIFTVLVQTVFDTMASWMLAALGFIMSFMGALFMLWFISYNDINGCELKNKNALTCIIS
jgi:hypothetical protein